MTIREIREALGLNQSKFAEKLGTVQTVVSRWESGTRRPNIDSLKKIAALYGCKVDDIEEQKKKLRMKDVFTREAFEGLTAEERRRELKYQQAAEYSGWRKYPTTMSKLHSQIPAEWWDKYTAEHIGEVMALLKTAFDNGVAHAKNHPDY